VDVLHKQVKQVEVEEVLLPMVHLITTPMVEVELVYMDKVLMVQEEEVVETHILITPLIFVVREVLQHTILDLEDILIDLVTVHSQVQVQDIIDIIHHIILIVVTLVPMEDFLVEEVEEQTLVIPGVWVDMEL
jgi:hypothetical protein